MISTQCCKTQIEIKYMFDSIKTIISLSERLSRFQAFWKIQSKLFEWIMYDADKIHFPFLLNSFILNDLLRQRQIINSYFEGLKIKVWG